MVKRFTIKYVEVKEVDVFIDTEKEEYKKIKEDFPIDEYTEVNLDARVAEVAGVHFVSDIFQSDYIGNLKDLNKSKVIFFKNKYEEDDTEILEYDEDGGIKEIVKSFDNHFEW